MISYDEIILRDYGKEYWDRPRPTIKSYSPATGEFLGEVPSLTHEDVILAVERARVAQESWSKTRFDERKKLLLRVNDLIYEKIDTIARTISLENGKTRTEALSMEVLPSLYAVQHAARTAERTLKDKPINMFLWRWIGKKSHIEHKPLGVIGIISPWNYPWGIPVGQIAYALAAGNTVVLKPSSSSAMISEHIREVFEETGFPEDVFTVVQGKGAVGEGLIEGGVDKLIFTGSVEVGRHVNQLAAKHLIPTVLELGGKDPAIVLEDADLDTASSGVIWGAFGNSGQTCAGIERAYVMDSIYEDFIEQVKVKAAKLRQGPDTDFNVDVGAMTTKAQLDIVESQVHDALRNGAEILVGGRRRDDLPGNYFEPTVLVDVCHSMRIMTEETFGPTLPIMKVSSVDEAIRLANDSIYGLTASVWTTDIARAKRIASKLVTGTVTINDTLSTYAMAETPWGGVKESGIGRTHGESGFMEMVRPLHVSLDTMPKVKKPWWYPYNAKLYGVFKKALVFMTGKGVGRKSSYLFDAVKGISFKEKL